jgi:poly(3-hydroxybutyrate) depolymerase
MGPLTLAATITAAIIASTPDGVETLDEMVNDGTTVERKTFTADTAGAPVVFYEIHGGGHTWPGGNLQPEALLGKTCHNINASELIWEFFATHKLPE